jgi:signal transduction histidine kinase
MDEKKIIFVLIIMMIVFALLFVGIILFMMQFRKSRLLHMEELMKTKLEIQDQTLTYLGRELHDNLGQLLTVSRIHVNSLMKQYAGDVKIAALDSVMDKTISELRALSKSLNSSRIHDFGLHKELGLEVERLTRMNIMKLDFSIEGEERPLPNDKAIILYRIIQEFLSNTIKYAQAEQLRLKLHYRAKQLEVSISDNGKGFDMTSGSVGSGVSNIRNRAQLLNVQNLLFQSEPGKGTHLSLTLPLE